MTDQARAASDQTELLRGQIAAASQQVEISQQQLERLQEQNAALAEQRFEGKFFRLLGNYTDQVNSTYCKIRDEELAGLAVFSMMRDWLDREKQRLIGAAGKLADVNNTISEAYNELISRSDPEIAQTVSGLLNY